MGGEIGGESDDEVDNFDDSILSNFVPVPIPILNEKRAVTDALARLQTDNAPVMWPSIDSVPVNEF